MKHLAVIQSEFLKKSDMKWDRLSLWAQKDYLKHHPKSKRRLTGISHEEKLQHQEESALAAPWFDKWLNADDYINLLKSATNLKGQYIVKEPFEIYQMTKSEANPNDMIGSASRYKYWLQKSDVKAGDKLYASPDSNEIILNNDRDHPIFVKKPHMPLFQEYPMDKLQKD